MRLAVQSAKGRTTYSAERLVNCYAEQAADKEPILIGTPGLTLRATFLGAGPIRGFMELGESLCVVCGGRLYVDDVDVGAIDGEGLVSMAENGTQLVIVTNETTGYIYDGTLTEITDTDFPGATSVDFLDGYFLFSEPESGSFFISAIYDGSDYDALDFATAESNPDNLVRVFVDHREVWLFGDKTVEVWSNTGAADFPFERIPGAINEKGISGRFTVARADNSTYWVDRDGIVRRAQGYDPLRVSTHEVEVRLKASNLTEAEAFTYVDEGHEFYVLTTDTGTFVYDAATQLWHDRKSDGRANWRARGCLRIGRDLVVGDRTLPKLYTLDSTVYTENGDYLISEIVFPPIEGGGRLFTIPQFQLEMQPASTQIMLQVSEDGLHWSDEVWTSGSGQRAVWRRLGQYARAHLKVKFSDETKRHIFHAFATVI